jgi:hypothetical protein
MTETVLTADGKPADRTNSLEGRRETDLQDKPLDGRRETDQQADNAGAFEREIQRCPKPPEAGSTGNRAHHHRHLECGLEESRPTPFLGTIDSPPQHRKNRVPAPQGRLKQIRGYFSLP